MLHDPKTVIGSDFDQETAEKIAPQFIPRLELANCILFEVNNFSRIRGVHNFRAFDTPLLVFASNTSFAKKFQIKGMQRQSI